VTEGLEQTPEEKLRAEAYREYEYCRQGIEKYDEHLFRIRQWSIGLTAVVLAAILGLSETGTNYDFEPPLALLIFTSISFAFWMLDALNKSLQTVHIHNSRDIEKFLRGTRSSYIGPTISLRFQRKEKRHWTSTVKNLTDQTVMMFHLLPILIFWTGILFKFRERLCLGIEDCQLAPLSRYTPLAPIVVILLLLYCSVIWRNGKRMPSWISMRSKYFLRPRAAARSKIYAQIFKALNGSPPCRCILQRRECTCGAKAPKYAAKVFPPFRADFSDKNTLLFIDRYKIYRDPNYIEERRNRLEDKGFRVLHIVWKREKLVSWLPFLKKRPQPQISKTSSRVIPGHIFKKRIAELNTTAYKILTAPQWAQFQSDGVFNGAPVDVADGYIHLSAADQLQGTLDTHFAGQAELVIAEVDLAVLGDAVRWEVSRGGALFPHVYGPLPMAAVLGTRLA
jgi:uncharacterized protein (DUF952 family)